MFNIGFQELLIILLVALILFGGRKLPDLARSLGHGLREFRSALGDIKKEVQDPLAPDRHGPRPKSLAEPAPPRVSTEEEAVPPSQESTEESPYPRHHGDAPKG